MSRTPERNERFWAVACHVGSLAVFLGLPFGNLIVPAAIWASYKGESRRVEAEARESINFQLTVLLAGLACAGLSIVGLGVPLLVALAVADVVLVVQAARAVGRGERYRYPFAIRLVP
ncbi:MAG: DUF4870 domain-containing protein [bacterium]